MALSWKRESKSLLAAERFIDMFPKHYSLHGDHEKHFAVHDARDNTIFHISKKDIHPATQIKVMRLQKFSGESGDPEDQVVKDDSSLFNRMEDQDAQGGKDTLGEVGLGPNDTSVQDAAKEARQMKEKEIFGTGTPQPDMALTPSPSIPGQIAGQLASTPETPPPPPPPRQPSATADQGPMSGFPTVQGLNQQQGQYENAINSGARGQIEQNRQLAELYAPKITAQEEAAGHFQKAMENYQKQADDLSTQIANQKIDPRHYWTEEGGGSKFGAALGILLSGIGAGMSRSNTNMAMDVIQGNINRDIDAQKAELGKKQTLLSDNFRKQGNLVAAEAATRAQYESIFQGKLAQMAAKTNNPMILATAQQQIMESRMRMQPHLQAVAQNQMVMGLRDSLNKAGQSGKPIEQDPSTYVPYLVPEARQKDVFDELKNAQDVRALAPKILDAFERGSSRNPNTAAQGQREFEGLINTTVKEKEGTARQAAFDSIHKSMTPSGLFAGAGENEAKKRTVMEYLGANSAAPQAKGFGINLDNFKSTAPLKSQNDQFLDWARQNPNTPQAKEIMQRLGR